MATIAEALDVALQYYQAGHWREAEQIYRQIVQADPNRLDGWCYLGSLCMGMGRLDEALVHYQQALRIDPSHAPAHNDLGIIFARQGKVEEASACFQQALQLQPGYVEARNNLDTVRRQQGLGPVQPEVTAPPSQAHIVARTHNRQGIALAQQGRLEEAVFQLQEALRLRPDYPEAHTNMGSVLYYQGNYDQAVAFYRHAIRLKPDDAGVYNNLGNVLSHQGRHAEAMAACQQALKLAPDDAGAYNNLGNAYKGLKDLEQAVASYRQAVRLKPDYHEAYNNLGLALLEQEKLDEAMAAYQQALRIKPDYADAYNHLGLALAESCAWTRPSRAMIERCRSIPIMRGPILPRALRSTSRANLLKQLPASSVLYSSSRTYRTPTGVVAWHCCSWATLRKAGPSTSIVGSVSRSRRVLFPGRHGMVPPSGTGLSCCMRSRVWVTRCSSFALFRRSRSASAGLCWNARRV